MSFWSTLATRDCHGNQRNDIKDFSKCKFEIQVQYNTGWEMLSQPSPWLVDQEWRTTKKRYRNVNLRLLQDGKVIRSN